MCFIDSKRGDYFIDASLHRAILESERQESSTIVYHMADAGGGHHPLARPDSLFCDRLQRYIRHNRCLCKTYTQIAADLRTLSRRMPDLIALEAATNALQITLFLLTLLLEPTISSGIANYSAIETFLLPVLVLDFSASSGAASFFHSLFLRIKSSATAAL